MAFIPVPNTVHVSIGMELEDKVASFGFHVTKGTPWDLNQMITLHGTVEAWAQDLPVTHFGITMALINIRITDLQTINSPVFEAPILPIARGTAATQQVPNNVAFVATLRTVNRGRSYRGRIYIAGMSEAAVNGNLLLSTAQTALASWFNDLVLLAFPDSGELAVVSRYTNNAPRTTGIATPVTAITFNARIDTQRRRLP